MAWWQKKLLRYALQRTGFLDDSVLDLDNLDMVWGKRNVIDLKNVGLNIARISKLAQLPSGVRLDVARVLSLRLTVPADIYKSSIVVELDGLKLVIAVDDTRKEDQADIYPSERTKVTIPLSQHRKAHRRTGSPSPHDPGGHPSAVEDHVPTAKELAMSFLSEEPARERQQLAASVVGRKEMESSATSESNETDQYGTGVAMGLPSLLAGFLQGILDRLRIEIQNIEIKVTTDMLAADGPVPVTLAVRIGRGAVYSTVAEREATDSHRNSGDRKVMLDDLSITLLSNIGLFEELSIASHHTSVPLSPTKSEKTGSSLRRSQSAINLPDAKTPSASLTLEQSVIDHYRAAPIEEFGHDLKECDTLFASRAIQDSHGQSPSAHFEAEKFPEYDELDIQLGEDNISWGSRRNKTSAPPEDLWKSLISEDFEPESLLIDRSPTPQARSSSVRSASPVALRVTNDSPKSTPRLENPGSWPTITTNRYFEDRKEFPGSWPQLDQEIHSLDHSLALMTEFPDQVATDNKSLALELSEHESDKKSESAQQIVSHREDLAESRIFSHEEAQSMYLSAMTHRADEEHSERGELDAALTSALRPSHEEAEELQPTVDQFQQSTSSLDTSPTDKASANESNVTPRTRSPKGVTASQVENQSDRSEASARLFHITSVVAVISSKASNTTREEAEDITFTNLTDGGRLPTSALPGTFSAYSELSMSRRLTSNEDDRSVPATDQARTSEKVQAVFAARVEVGVTTLQLDISSTRILHHIGIIGAAVAQKKNEAPSPRSRSATAADSNQVQFAIRIKKLHVGFQDCNLARHTSDRFNLERSMISLICREVDFQSTQVEQTGFIECVEVLAGRSYLLRFDKDSSAFMHSVPTSAPPDISISISKPAEASKQQHVSYIKIHTQPLHILLDIPAINDAFDFLGGLSGVLEVGSSVIHDSGLTSPVSPVKETKGVRFLGEPPLEVAEPNLKLDLVLEAVKVVVKTESCSIACLTTKIKALYRDGGQSGATVSDVSLIGPYLHEQTAPLSVRLTSIRLEYANSPQDKDLERLLALLTPSKDKYDNDDDILVDTLLRQRRKGAVFRLLIGDAKLRCDDLDCLSMISRLNEDLAKLAVVAKYLPKDDRPGILTLIRVNELDASLPINARFGILNITCRKLHCAHVGLPLLLALSVDDFSILRNSEEELVHGLLSVAESNPLPVIMLRMLEDKMEPYIKIKLYNLCIEYSAPTLLALTNIDLELDPENALAELARSVASMTTQRQDIEASRTSLSEDSITPKAMRVDLLINQTAIGLNSSGLTSKGLILITRAHFATTVPSEDLRARVDIDKITIFLADEPLDLEDDFASKHVTYSRSTDGERNVSHALTNRGYISVASIIAARIDATESGVADKELKTLDVAVNSRLILLETCADSTQTLISIMNGLSPPSRPSKQPKYLTQPMTIDDMMASFSGEPYVEPEPATMKLFDVEEDILESSDTILQHSLLDHDSDGLLADSDMTSSLYGPISRILEPADQSEQGESPDDLVPTVESLLDDDPFEMTIHPTNADLSDNALMRELDKQAAPSRNQQSVTLDLWEVEDLGFDALDGQQTVLGSKYRFQTNPFSKMQHATALNGNHIPFRLKVRDLHIIWNVYDGYDWQRTRDGLASAVEQVEMRAEQRRARQRQYASDNEEEDSVIEDFLFNSIYIGIPSNNDAQDLRRQINRAINDQVTETESVQASAISRPTMQSNTSYATRKIQPRRLRLSRSRAHKVAFEIKGLSVDLLVFPPESKEDVSSIDIRVQRVDIFDNVPTSTWRKFLTYENDGTREMFKPQFHIQVSVVRTLEDYAASELVIHVSVLPLRLHVDQDALDFITRFFEFKDSANISAGSPGEQPFIQRLEVDTVDMCLDYKPKKIDYAGLRSGHATEFMNFITLDAANIRLKHAIVYGIRGFEPLHKTLNDVWMPDIRRNQLPTILAGLAPVRSLVNIGSGVRDVIAIPVREYRKDGRVVRSIQKGAFHFGKTTSSELARLGAKVALGTQTILQGAESLLSPPRTSLSGRDTLDEEGYNERSDKRPISAYADQPLGVLSGLRSARRHLERDLLTAMDALIAVQGEVLDSSSPGDVAAAVARHAPTIIIRPITGVSRAMGTALLGIGNQIDRDNLRRVQDKYKSG